MSKKVRQPETDIRTTELRRQLLTYLFLYLLSESESEYV